MKIFRKSKSIPSDYDILNEIYELHYDDFIHYMNNREGNTDRNSKIYVPVNILAVAHKLNVDPDIIFGRLYYDLEKRYGYEQSNGAKVAFFTPRSGSDKNCINFPYLSSVVADLREKRKKYHTAIVISFISLGFALISLFRSCNIFSVS